MNHNGPGHDDVTLTLSETQPDGSTIFQSWTICGCTLPALRARLGDPQQETIASPQAVRDSGRAILNVPGAVHKLSGQPRF